MRAFCFLGVAMGEAKRGRIPWRVPILDPVEDEVLDADIVLKWQEAKRRQEQEDEDTGCLPTSP
jgi:hypothetical protein